MLIPVLFPSFEEFLVSSCIFTIGFQCVASYTKRIVSEFITHAAIGRNHLKSLVCFTKDTVPTIVAIG
jgi:hypothetical protein